MNERENQTEPFYLAGGWRTSSETIEVRSPFDGTLVATVAEASVEDAEQATQEAVRSFQELAVQPLHVRYSALSQIADALEAERDSLVTLLAREAGKPVKWGTGEVAGTISVFRWGAEEARRDGGEFIRLDTEASLGSRAAILRRFPRGPVLGITPFNFPLSLAAHKLAPAIAVGAPIVLKPASATPLTSLRLAHAVDSANLVEGAVSVLPLRSTRAEKLAADPRFTKLSFTGSSVGWDLKRLDARKHTTLELGGNAAVVVHDDCPDIEDAATRVATGAFYQAGQSCISVQRVLVQKRIYDEYVDALVRTAGELTVGDPLDPLVDVGPLINLEAVTRVEERVEEAIAAGATRLCGGRREGSLYWPTVLENVPHDIDLYREEIFGPVCTVEPYVQFEDALAEVNNSRYGLQAGVFTQSLERALLAHRTLEVGGVMINDVSEFRAEQMPYGGVKDSGVGREGLRWAIEGMTEPRLLVLNGVPL
jgi:acyl-CoA reductase-like NAD-dependent aldehyde dehydrogenase